MTSPSSSFPGDVQTVRRYLRQAKEGGFPAVSRPAPPPRRAVRWIATNRGRLSAGDARELKEVRAVCPHLGAAAGHIRDFAAMLHDRRGALLPDWMTGVLADGLPALHSLVTGLRRDQDAVVAGLSSSRSSGQVEGHVTRIKILKRKGHGRANLGLLRKRVLSTT
ncbi:transposase [Streptomyces sp. NPDC086776]|uniref:transposase n=1 Tax=Streptomyces sp. NPDC086776 TaxID=3365756 RepID=UPI0037F75102